MAKTIQVAAERENRPEHIVTPAETIRPMFLRNPPNLAAHRLFRLLIGIAGGRMADDTRHELRLADLAAIPGLSGYNRTDLNKLLAELRDVGVTLGDPDDDNQVVTGGGLIDHYQLDKPNPTSGEVRISWYFARMFRDMAARSDHYAILDRQTLFQLNSKYSLRLYELITSYENRQKQFETFTVEQLRQILGVREAKLNTFNELRKRAINPAIEEINKLSRLTLQMRRNMAGRAVKSVTISWTVKDDPAVVKRELDASSVGRNVRLAGSADSIVESFPATGPLTDFWIAIKRQAGCNMDNTMLADTYRAWCKSKSIPLDHSTQPKAFATFCTKVPRQ